ncbi:MAG: uroporphyrinogen decarboxylase family protein [Lentisphaerae bacterium]|nr:uroporphyrinogen decarboxylase family protein [Lentisphaerota bacterium]
MTGLERCLTVLRGGIPDRVPVVPQTFLFSLETARVRVADVVRNPGGMADALALSQATFGYDGCVIDFDDATMAEALGAKVHFRDNDPAVVDEDQPVLKDLRDVESLRLPDPWTDGRLPIWLETTQRLVDKIGDHVFIMGRADQGPFSIACLLRGAQPFMMDLMDEDNAELIHRLLDFCRQAVARFALAQKAAGAHATSIGDAFAGPNLISPDLYRRFALDPERQLAAEVQSAGIPLSIHICGNTNRIIGDMGTTGARILEVDWMLDMAAARAAVPPATVLMGNVNPSDPLVLGTPATVEAAARRAMDGTGGRGLILSSGCAMGRNTPPENMKALVAAAARWRL